jgi:hypothetical protein
LTDDEDREILSTKIRPSGEVRVKRVTRFVLLCALLFSLAAGVARAAYEVTYWNYWMNPGDDWTSNWDIPGNRWFCSFLYRDRNAYGTVAFIAAGSYIDFTKVCLCKNSDPYSIYWGRCVGRRNGTW